MLASDLGQVLRQSVPAPDELQVNGPLLIAEALKDSPEAMDYLVVRTTVGIGANRLEPFSLDAFAATCTCLDGIIVQIAGVAQVALENSINTVLNRLVLLTGFFETSFDDKLDKLLNISLADLTSVTILAKIYLISIREHSRECLIDGSFVFFIRQLSAIISQVSQNL